MERAQLSSQAKTFSLRRCLEARSEPMTSCRVVRSPDEAVFGEKGLGGPVGSKASSHGRVSPVSAGRAPTHEAVSFLSSVAYPLGDAGIFSIRLISNL